MKKLFFFLILVFTLSLTAQEAILSTGGEANGNAGLVSYSVGQVTFNTITSQHGSLVQGVQQAYEISINTSIEDLDEIQLNCQVFPNPAIDKLILKVGNLELEPLNIQLINLNGELIENRRLTSNETTIDMGSLKSAIYFLKIIYEQREIKVFKIVKTK